MILVCIAMHSFKTGRSMRQAHGNLIEHGFGAIQNSAIQWAGDHFQPFNKLRPRAMLNVWLIPVENNHVHSDKV